MDQQPMTVFVTGASAGFGAAIARRFVAEAESVHWAACQPAHVNVNTIQLMPTAQSFAAFQMHRDAPG